MRLTGVLAPLPTPFDESGALDVTQLRAALPRWVVSPLTGFVVLGTNGDAGLLNEREADTVIAETRAGVPAGRTLLAGTARESTREAIAAAVRAAELGADAVLVRTPCFFKSQMTPAAFERHYLAIADASPVPVLLYNFTAATGVNLLPETVGRLAAHPKIVGIKESGSEFAQIAQIADLVAVAPPGFTVLAGSASMLQAAWSAGVSGAIVALGGLLPEACVRLFELMRDGKHQAALLLLGIDAGYPRLPLAPAPNSAVDALHAALHAFEDVFA